MWKKYLSRRFLVFMVGTILVVVGKIDGWVWFATAVAYISVNTLEKILKGGGWGQNG